MHELICIEKWKLGVGALVLLCFYLSSLGIACESSQSEGTAGASIVGGAAVTLVMFVICAGLWTLGRLFFF